MVLPLMAIIYPISRISGSDLRDADGYVREDKYDRLGLKIE